MALGGLSGIASGVDTATIVEQLIMLERQPVTKMGYRERAVTAEQSAVKGIQNKLKTLGDAADALKSIGLWSDVQSVTSSDPTRIGVTQPVGFVPPSAVTIKVSALATGAQSRFDWNTPTADTTLWIADGVSLTVKAGSTAADAAAAINAVGAGVYAGVVDGQLVVSSRDTGAAQAPPEIREGGKNYNAATRWKAATTIAGTNADITVNGVRDTSHATNEFWLADQGLQISLKAPTTTDVTIAATSPAVDKTAVKDKLKAFVDAYNDVITTINRHVTEKPVQNASIGLDYEKGTLFGDSGLSSIASRLRRQVSEPLTDPATGNPVAFTPRGLFDIGISTGKGANGASTPDAKLGKLVIDDAKLDAALADPAAVKALFAGKDGIEGFTAKLDKVIDSYAGTGGALEGRVKGADSRIRAIKDQVEAAERRLEAKEKRYKAQFAAMEKAMGLAQTQSSWLAGQIASLPAYSI